MSIIPNICNAIRSVTLTRTRFNKAINHTLTTRRRPVGAELGWMGKWHRAGGSRGGGVGSGRLTRIPFFAACVGERLDKSRLPPRLRVAHGGGGELPHRAGQADPASSPSFPSVSQREGRPPAFRESMPSIASPARLACFPSTLAPLSSSRPPPQSVFFLPAFATWCGLGVLGGGLFF